MSIYKPSTKYAVTNHIAVLLVLLIIFVSIGYFLLLGRPDEVAATIEHEQQYESALARWAEEAPPDYRYVVDRTCDCPPEETAAYVVTVSPTGTSAAYPIPVESSEGDMLTVPPAPVLIDDLFGLIGQHLRDEEPVEATYHYLHGFPDAVDLAPGAASPDRYEVRDFEIIRDP